MALIGSLHWRAMLLIGLVIVTSTLSAWALYLDHETGKRYGTTPGLNLALDPQRLDCTEVLEVIPKAHWRIWGAIWQEPTFPWEHIRIEESDGTVFAHGHAGPVRVGDRVCGLSNEENWVYVPEDRVFFGPRHGKSGQLG